MPLNTKHPPFVDAQEQKRKQPKSFAAPSESEVKALGVGDYIKACPQYERFWLQVESIGPGKGFDRKFTARVDNDLLCTEEHLLKLDDIVELQGKHIYLIYRN